MEQRVVIRHPLPQERNIKEEVAAFAYALYERRGKEDGHDLDDWLQAEHKIMTHEEDRGF